jgi:polar amino acid transport system permease protein
LPPASFAAKQGRVLRTTLNSLVIAILGATFCFFFYVVLSHDYRWEAVRPYAGNLWAGWGMTLLVSVVSLVLSVLIAAGLTVGQLSKNRAACWLSRAYVEFVRGTPLLTQILIAYYLVAPALNWDNKFGVGVLILAAFAGAYLSEIFRGGILSIPKSQWESARAIGLTGVQAYRYVVIPQAIRRVLPATAGQFANLIKDSSLLYVIGLGEFTMQAREANSNTYATFESYLPLAIGYLALTLPISLSSRWLEHRTGYEH